MSVTKLTDLIGKTFDTVELLEIDKGLKFSNKEESWTLTHVQECCESVNLIDFDTKDLNILSNATILDAEERSEDEVYENSEYMHKWTFYSFATTKGTVDLRFYGESSVYYGIGVSLIKNF